MVWRILILCLCMTVMMSCQQEMLPSCGQYAILLERDYSKWICGGGWKIQLDQDTLLVNDNELMRGFIQQLSEDGIILPTEIMHSLDPLDESNYCSGFQEQVVCIERVF